jgi:hypothetical protein
MEDISSILSIEVKKEIADRYFRFRKIIEEDTNTYRQEIITLSLDLERSIGLDLVCIYSLLKDEDLIHHFFDISGLSERFFFECEINTSPTLRKRVLASKRLHGLTKKSRFKNLFYDSYSDLYNHIMDYRETLSKLNEDYETIREQINLFYRKNDITGILQFLKGLDGSATNELGSQGAIIAMGDYCRLDEKLRLNPPDPVEDLLPNVEAIPSLKKVRSQIKHLVQSAWSRQSGLDLRCL